MYVKLWKKYREICNFVNPFLIKECKKKKNSGFLQGIYVLIF